MQISHVTTELTPIAKTGGLADVLYGLSRELSYNDHQVEVILPKYDILNLKEVQNLQPLPHPLTFLWNGQQESCTIFCGWLEKIRVTLIEAPPFNTGCIYGTSDDLGRFLYFSQAATALLTKRDTPPKIVHLHDWPTALIAYLLKQAKQPGPKTLLTIHNLEHQGKCTPDSLEPLGLKAIETASFTDPNRKDLFNLLKVGILHSDYCTTVSPTYAKEVQCSTSGYGLETVLAKEKQRFKGILNGLDSDYWNPAKDPHIMPRKKLTLQQWKAKVKRNLRKELALYDEKQPLLSAVTRLVPQKGLEQIKQAIYFAEQKQVQFVLLGCSPIPKVQEEFCALAKKHEKSGRIRLILEQNEALAHKIFAASDMLIVPSLFEPCGLTQMISLRYGALPIVRKTGGLADTIFDIDQTHPTPNGFSFDNPTKEELENALERAITLWKTAPNIWQQVQIKAANTDTSWHHPAKEYLSLYKAL